jgi:hypothetical protein
MVSDSCPAAMGAPKGDIIDEMIHRFSAEHSRDHGKSTVCDRN